MKGKHESDECGIIIDSNERIVRDYNLSINYHVRWNRKSHVIQKLYATY